MADLARVRSRYVAGMQHAARAALELNNTLDNLNSLHNGAGLAGTFSDPELAADATSAHLAAADVAQVTADLSAIRAAITNAMTQRLFKALGKPLGT